MNEKTIILQMVENGRINVDEAVKLLKALDSSTSKNNFKNDLESNFQKVSNSLDTFTKDFKSKISNLTKNDCSKLKENTQVFFSKTGEVIDDFSKSVKNLFTPEENEQVQNTNNENINYDNFNKEKDLNQNTNTNDFN